MKTIVTAIIGLALFPSCNREQEGAARTTIGLVATIDHLERPNIEAAYAIPVDSYQQAFGQAAAMCQAGKAAAELQQLVLQATERQSGLVSSLKRMYQSRDLDSGAKSSLLQLTEQVSSTQHVPADLDLDMDVLNNYAGRRQIIIDALVKPANASVEKIATTWTLQELDRMIVGGYESRELNEYKQDTSLTFSNYVKGQMLSPSELTFELEPTKKYVIIAMEATEGPLVCFADPTLSATVSFDREISNMAHNIINSANLDSNQNNPTTLDVMPRLVEAREDLNRALANYANLESVADSIATEIASIEQATRHMYQEKAKAAQLKNEILAKKAQKTDMQEAIDQLKRENR